MGEDAKFTNAEIGKRANVYYDGAVTSRELYTDDGVRRTLGIMRPGEYTFETEREEEIEVQSGSAAVTVDGETERYGGGDAFTVPAGTEFTVDVDELVDYCCTYR